jgi:hypothetical protein
MENSSDLPQLYRDLADGYAAREQPQFRDRFLVLAADAALSNDDDVAAERYRQRLLAVNPHHLLKPYASFAQAMQAPDVQTYVNDLRQSYPADVAKTLLRSLQDLKDTDGPQIPVTAPLLRLDVPDLLMDDENEPLRIFSFHDDPPSGLPPTLPPSGFPASPALAPPRGTIPKTLFEAEPPVPLPSPQPAPPRLNKPVPAPVARPTPAPAPRATPAPRTQPRSLPVPDPPLPASDEDDVTAGAWLPGLLFVVVATGALALAIYAVGYPFLPR